MSGRDVTEAIQWIKEKEPQLTSEDYGKDLVSSEALFHIHKGLQRNLAVMDDKVSHFWRNVWKRYLVIILPSNLLFQKSRNSVALEHNSSFWFITYM